MAVFSAAFIQKIEEEKERMKYINPSELAARFEPGDTVRVIITEKVKGWQRGYLQLEGFSAYEKEHRGYNPHLDHVEVELVEKYEKPWPDGQVLLKYKTSDLIIWRSSSGEWRNLMGSRMADQKPKRSDWILMMPESS